MNRRHFLRASALTLAATRLARAQATSPFNISVITDEISDDFDHACYIAANEFGLRFVELRSLWKKTVTALDIDDFVRAEAILAKYNLKVVDIASPLFKVDFPGAPLNATRAKAKPSTNVEADYRYSDELIALSIGAANAFKCDHLRCFDFWRIDDPAPFRKEIDAKLQAAAERYRKAAITLVLENEHECNTGTARESVRTLASVPAISLNWDPGNAVMAGELDAFPTGFNLLPKNRIHHCHVKNAVKDASGKIAWSPVDIGIIDWTKQFAALKAAGYKEAVSLETHWRGEATPEASTRTSWAGMKKCLTASNTL
jgi:sugar phosphate isomerase/epimerase